MAQYGDALYRTCYLYVKDAHLAQDALQDTFLKAYRSYDRLRDGQCVKPWLFSIAVNVCKDYLRKSRFFVWGDERAAAGQSAWDEYAGLGDNTVSAAIMRLKPKYKEIVLLYYYQEFNLREIARILNIPEGTAGVRLKRARDVLKTNLKGWYEHEYQGSDRSRIAQPHG